MQVQPRGPEDAATATTGETILRIQRHGPGRGAHGAGDRVVVEEPLEIRVDGAPLAILMRTPGADRALAAGFLFSEGVIDGPDDLRALGPCRDPGNPYAANTMLAVLQDGIPDLAARLDGARRAGTTSAGCGLCGKTTVAQVLALVARQGAVRERAPAIPRARLAALLGAVEDQQPLFAGTGAVHGAALLTAAGGLTMAEDVGRHNALDKIIGTRLLDGAPGDDPGAGGLLWLSGRAGFEMVQKAARAGVDGIVSVGAPTSLSVALAEACGVTLVGFCRGADRFNVYVGSVTP